MSSQNLYTLVICCRIWLWILTQLTGLAGYVEYIRLLHALHVGYIARVKRIISRLHIYKVKYTVIRYLQKHGKLGRIFSLISSEVAVALLHDLSCKQIIEVVCLADGDQRTLIHWCLRNEGTTEVIDIILHRLPHECHYELATKLKLRPFFMKQSQHNMTPSDAIICAAMIKFNFENNLRSQDVMVIKDRTENLLLNILSSNEPLSSDATLDLLYEDSLKALVDMLIVTIKTIKPFCKLKTKLERVLLENGNWTAKMPTKLYEHTSIRYPIPRHNENCKIYAVIAYNTHCGDVPRPDAGVEFANLYNALRSAGFSILPVMIDFSACDFLSAMEERIRQIKQSCSLLLICIMSHGSEGVIYDVNGAQLFIEYDILNLLRGSEGDQFRLNPNTPTVSSLFLFQCYKLSRYCTPHRS